MPKRRDLITAAIVLSLGVAVGWFGASALDGHTTGVEVKFCPPIVGKFITPRVC